jgi:predicted NUDIX family NTP pyrophosphohydrolase
MGKVEDKAFAQVLDRIFQEKVKRVKTIALDSAKQPGGKVVHVWAIEEDWDPADLQSNTFEMEWPPRSGRRQSFPELDRASWFGIAEARLKILKGQAVFLDHLLETLARAEGSQQVSANGRLLP